MIYESCFEKETAKNLTDLNCEAEREPEDSKMLCQKDSSRDSAIQSIPF